MPTDLPVIPHFASITLWISNTEYQMIIYIHLLFFSALNLFLQYKVLIISYIGDKNDVSLSNLLLFAILLSFMQLLSIFVNMCQKEKSIPIRVKAAASLGESQFVILLNLEMSTDLFLLNSLLKACFGVVFEIWSCAQLLIGFRYAV